MRSLQRKNNSGFLLLEVILSVLIIGSVLMLVVRSYSASLKACQVAGGLSKACGLLEDKLFDLDIRGFADGIGETSDSGTFEGEPGYLYSVSVNPMGDEKKLNKVNLQAAWKRHTINVWTYLKFKEG
jgi:hypothetical protein